MTSLANHHSSEFVKLIYIGDSGTGKTGSLISLVQAGYKLRILDLDNGLESLRHLIDRECPDRMAQVDFETRRDRFKIGPITEKGKSLGQGPVAIPTAYVDSVKLLEKWTDDTKPEEWGADTIFVIDSLTALARAAFNWARGMDPGVKDPRQWYGTAQSAVEHNISLLTSEAFHCNLIVISHIHMSEGSDGTSKGYPSSIGSALDSHLPKYFNTLVQAELIGIGKNVKRRIKTVPTGQIDLKNPTPWKFESDLPLETGLATIFEGLKATQKEKAA